MTGGSEADGPYGHPWELPYPAAVFALEEERDWLSLRALYSRGLADEPLKRCLDVVRDRAKSAVVETRYVDYDYRSEYSTFYSRAFASIPDTAQRVHFFSERVVADQLWTLPEEPGYLGYLVIRPDVPGVVGRTVLVPPREMEKAVRTSVTEPVMFFGQELTVTGVPFIQQDARLDRCAHAAVWVCHYTAFRRGDLPRRPIATFSLNSDSTLAVGRPLPSPGLNRIQVSNLFTSVELPPIYYEIRGLTDNDLIPTWKPKTKGTPSERVARICRRYMDSGIPILAALYPTGESREGHAYVVCGYERDPKGAFRLVVQDDQRGPYLWETSISGIKEIGVSSEYEWRFIFAPLPDKLWLGGEAAERFGRFNLLGAARFAAPHVEGARKFLDLHGQGRLEVRSYACKASDFKTGVRKRFADDPAVVEHYSYARLSRYIWVVEAIDRLARDRTDDGEQACVVGEAVFDATSDDLEPSVLALRLPGIFSVPRPNNSHWDVATGTGMHRSGGVCAP
jgi:hypothetical protein